MNRWMRLLAPLLAAAVVFIAPGPASAAAGFTAGPYHLRFANSGRCLDDPDYTTVWGAWLDQWSCVNQTNEQWYFDYASDGSRFRIRGVSSGMCVTVGRVKQDPLGTLAVLFPCDPDRDQYFQLMYDPTTDTPPGVYWWFAPSSDTTLALNVMGGSTANGGQIILWPRGAYTNEYIDFY